MCNLANSILHINEQIFHVIPEHIFTNPDGTGF